MSQGMWEASKTGKGPQLTASKELGPRTAIQLQGTESTNNLSEEECRFSPRAFRNMGNNCNPDPHHEWGSTGYPRLPA